VEPDAISVVELGAGGQTTRLPIRDARGVAASADQLWIATHDDQLARVDHAGRALGPAHSLPFSARAVIQPAPCGPVAAVWSSNPALALIDDFGQLAATELADVDIALPLTGRRFVTARGAKLTLPSGLVTTLAPNTTVLGGAVMADGKSVTLLVAHAGGRQLIVVSLGTSQITQRCATLSPTVRRATRRSLANRPVRAAGAPAPRFTPGASSAPSGSIMTWVRSSRGGRSNVSSNASGSDCSSTAGMNRFRRAVPEPARAKRHRPPEPPPLADDHAVPAGRRCAALSHDRVAVAVACVTSYP
jgi:hypothetical protein